MTRDFGRTVAAALLFTAAAAGAAWASGSHGDSPEAFLHRGESSLAHHRWGDARRYFLLTLERKPGSAEAHAGLGSYYLHLGERERAREEFDAALRLNPHLAAAEQGVHAARTEGEEEQAFVQLQEQALQEPDNSDVRTTLAEELLERRRLDPARHEAEAALRLNPREGHAMTVLGQIAAQTGDPAAARRWLLAAVRQDGRDDEAFAALGDMAMAARDWPEAVSSYRRAVALFPNHADWHRKLADALAASGKDQDAAQERETADRLAAPPAAATDS